jgi:hypothetical protein
MSQCLHPHEMLSRTDHRYRYLCHTCGQVVTSRQAGLNPRAIKTNPRAKAQRRWKRREHT